MSNIDNIFPIQLCCAIGMPFVNISASLYQRLNIKEIFVFIKYDMSRDKYLLMYCNAPIPNKTLITNKILVTENFKIFHSISLKDISLFALNYMWIDEFNSN